MNPGDVTITPVGEPKRFQHAGENVVVLLRLAPTSSSRSPATSTRSIRRGSSCTRISAHPTPSSWRSARASSPAWNPRRAEPHARRIAHRAAVGPPASSIQLRVIARAQARSATLAAEAQRVLDFIDANLREDIVVRPRRTARDEPRPFRTPVSSDDGAAAPSIRARAQDRPRQGIAARYRPANHRDRRTGRMCEP